MHRKRARSYDQDINEEEEINTPLTRLLKVTDGDNIPLAFLLDADFRVSNYAEIKKGNSLRGLTPILPSQFL